MIKALTMTTECMLESIYKLACVINLVMTNSYNAAAIDLIRQNSKPLNI